MPQLSQLSEDVALNVISLPFKAAMLISHADDIEGGSDDVAEMEAIRSGLSSISGRYTESALIGEVVQSILQMHEQWPSWEEQSFHVVKLAPSAVQAVQSEWGIEEARHYRNFILDLAKSVAKAHSEFEAFDDGTPAKPKGFFGNLMGKLCGDCAPKSKAGDPSNVSPSEKAALVELSTALKINE